MEGLAQEDFFTWAGQDHNVYRRAYRKASRGALPLLHCDYGVDYAALTLQPVNEGMLLLSQLAVAEKLAVEPTARRMLVNMLNYAAGYSLPSRPVASAIEDPRKTAALDDTGLVYQKGEDPVALIKSGEFEIVIVEATPHNISALAGARETVNDWAEQGNWLMVWGLEPSGLEEFNKLVGFEHLIRPFRLEKVTKAGTDSLSAGLPAGALQVMTNHKFHRHTGQTYRDWNLFSYILDYRDVAPFAEWPEPSYFGHPGEATDYTAAADNLPLNMVNGMTEEDYWVYGFSIHLFDNDPTKWTIELPRRETLDEFSLVMNNIYHEVTQMRLVFDGDEDSALSLSLDTTGARQDFALDGRQARRITIELTEWNPRGSRDVIGVGNVWLTARRSEEFLRRVTPLVDPAGLMRYDVGQGGIVLNQVKIMDDEPVAVNADKKRAILTTLLRNMGAGFSSSRVVLPGMDLEYEPVFMKNYVNLFLDMDHNWPDKQADLSLMPLGNQTFAGVDYQVYDYATALFPHAVTLEGVVKEPAGGTELAQAVRGMEVGKKADALFMLHTLLPGENWRPRRRKGAQREELPPVVFRYVVKYADGKSQTVPVRLKHHVDAWLTRTPDNLPDARLAWTGKAPRGRKSAVWQMVWSNPRPDVAIESVDLEYGPDGAQWGSPVLFAITVARER
jgi:beta-galactosidase